MVGLEVRRIRKRRSTIYPFIRLATDRFFSSGLLRRGLLFPRRRNRCCGRASKPDFLLIGFCVLVLFLSDFSYWLRAADLVGSVVNF